MAPSAESSLIPLAQQFAVLRCSNALTDNRALFLPEPRIGFAWNLFGDGRTSITGGAGFHHTLLDALDYRLDQAAPYNTVYSYSNTIVANPAGGTGLISPSSVDTSIFTPALLAYDLKIEQQIAPATSISVGYVGSHSYHQMLNGDLNEPAYVLLSNGRVFYPAAGTPTTPAAPVKANPAVANTTSWWSGGSGNYNAMIVDVRHNLSHGLQIGGNYTWSKTSTTAQHGTPRSPQTRPRLSLSRRCRTWTMVLLPRTSAMQWPSMEPMNFPLAMERRC